MAPLLRRSSGIAAWLQKKTTLDVDVHQPRVGLVTDVLDRSPDIDSGIVDEDIETTKPVDGCIDDLAAGCGTAEIAGCSNEVLAAESGDGGGDIGSLAAVDGDARTLFQEGPRRGKTDPPRRAGHENAFSVKGHGCVSSCCRQAPSS